MAFELLVPKREAALEQDDGHGQGNHRKQDIAKDIFRVQKACHRAGDDAASEQKQDGRHTNPPGSPLANQGGNADTCEDQGGANGHKRVPVG